MGPRRMRKQGSDDEEERDAFESPVQSDQSDEEVDAQEEADPPEKPQQTTAPALQEAQQAAPQETPAATTEAAPQAGSRPPMPQGSPPSRPPVRPKIIEEHEAEVEITGHLDSSGDEEVAVREDAQEAPAAKKEPPEEVPHEVIVPRATQYFLHDDRYDEPKAGENGHADDRDASDAPGRKGKGRQRVFSAEDDGPWKHDKYYELVEEDRRRGGPPKSKGSRRTGGEPWRPTAWEAWEDWAGWEQDGRWDNSWSKGGAKGGTWRKGEWVPGTWQPRGW